MKNFLLISLLLCSIRGFAFSWEKVGENAVGNSFYVDVDNIEKRQGIVYYKSLIDFLKPTKNGAYSHVSKYKVDCVEQRQTWLSNVFYNKPMGKGERIIEAIPVWNHYGSTLNEVRSLSPGSIEDRVTRFVCDRTE
ncbi:MAG: hypothetical protein CBC42_04565 [Betaproteobacteria bacterium TMED82]|nr:MAG: hypothetical protein CBC42_04565 [Betaproteobacteria bacterium TMED82]|tara:strand:+ start:3824 stop:4231 length:408 start_codon:yes stop_codon:yes gene_type:complete